MNEHDDDIGAKAGEIWTLRNGKRAIIDSTNGRPPLTIVGRILCPQWELPWSWTANGHSNPNTPPVRRGFDSAALVSRYDWRAELAPIWAVLSPQYRWLAQDDDGRWWCYVNRPIESDSRWKDIAGPTAVRLNHLVFPEPDCPWYETLTERPD